MTTEETTPHVLTSEEQRLLIANGMTRMKADSRNPDPQHITHGVKHTLMCQWCFKPFDRSIGLSGLYRDSIQLEPLRKALRISDATFIPVICDGCLDYVLGCQVRELVPGHGPPGSPELVNNALRMTCALAADR